MPVILPSSWTSVYEDHCSYFPAMAGWFLFSSLLSTYNKFVFGNDHMAFPCPLLMTTVHFLAQWIFSAAVCSAFPETMGGDRIDRMSWKEWLLVSIPCGLVTSGDVGLSNLSVVTLSLTFYTMVKASTPVFVLGWAYAFGIERITWPLLGVVVIIALGEFLTVAGEVDFKWKGFLLCLSASMMSGARWTLVQLKIQTMEPPLKTTIATMKLLAPSMFFTLLFVSLLIEEPWNRLNGRSVEYMMTAFGLGMLGASLAISMILCEFYLIMYSSAIILMIGGVVKELLTIFLGVAIFKDKLNGKNMMGCFVVFLGVAFYKVVFHMEKKGKKTATGRYRPVESNEDELVQDAFERVELSTNIEESAASDSRKRLNAVKDFRKSNSIDLNVTSIIKGDGLQQNEAPKSPR